MGITNQDRFTDSLANRYRPVPYFPGTMGTLVAGRIYSMWLAGSIFGGIGATPPTTPGAACDSTTSGAVPVPTPAGGDTVHELPLQLAAGGAGESSRVNRGASDHAARGAVPAPRRRSVRLDAAPRAARWLAGARARQGSGPDQPLSPLSAEPGRLRAARASG